MYTFDGKLARPGFKSNGKRSKKIYVKLTDADVDVAIVLHQDDPTLKPGSRLAELKIRSGSGEARYWMMESDLRQLANTILKQTVEERLDI